MAGTDAAVDTARRRLELNRRLRKLLVDGLDLAVDPELLDDDQPLFGRGLELDSLDTLEIVSFIDEEFAVTVSDDQRYVFGSVNKLADHVMAQLGPDAGGR